MNSYNRPYGGSYRPPKPPTPTPIGASPAYMAKVLGIKSIKSTTPVPSLTPAKKRARRADDDEMVDTKPPQKKKVKGEEPGEKRLRRFRQKAPITYADRLLRVRTQRMFMIERNRTISSDGTHPEETFDIAGSTGNVYQVLVSKVPTCSCPDASLNGNQCKHIIYVMVNILKAREDLAYQLALLTCELNEIFAAAPITQKLVDDATSLSTDTGGVRKPIEGDCPVCVMEFEEGEDLVWCKAACGQNVHRTCFEQWQRSKPGQQAKCVFCRSLWKTEDKDIDMNKISKEGVKNHEGYVNVAGELGISQERDMSTYHPFWVSQQRGYYGGGSSQYRRRRHGYDEDDEDGYGSCD